MLEMTQPIVGTILKEGICKTCQGKTYQIKERLSGMYSTGYHWICPKCDHICSGCGQPMRKDEWCTGTFLQSNYVCVNQFCPGKIRKVGLLGGTFNPIHFGHLRFAEGIRQTEHFDRILFVPAFDPVHKEITSEKNASFDNRVQMIEAAIADNPYFDVSRIEETLDGKSYSYDMIQSLQNKFPNFRFTFVTGIESWVDLKKWYRYKEILNLCDFIFFGFSEKTLERWIEEGPIEILKNLESSRLYDYKNIETNTTVRFKQIYPFFLRSTDIRYLKKAGKSVRYLVPDPVWEMIEKLRLYTN
jgi:nicotinate-nucleotide adenylyltransferase